MDINLTLDQAPLSKELTRRIRRNLSDDSNPFFMSELHIFDATTKGPLTIQNIRSLLFSLFQSLPISRYQEHLNRALFEDKGSALDGLFGLEKQNGFEEQLEKWLTAYANQVRSPLNKAEFPHFLRQLYAYLGRVHFFGRTFDNIFTTPHYYCLNINAFIITQNKHPQTRNKVALFSFFASD